MLFTNFRKFDADATTSGNPTDPTQNPNPQVEAPATPQVQDDKEANLVAIRKQLEKANKELETYKNAQSKAESMKLEEDGKFKELLEKERAEKLELQARISKNEQQAQLSRELQNAGLSGKNLDLALLTISGKVDMTATDATALIQTEIKQFQTDYPALFEAPAPFKVGSTSVNGTTNPTGTGMSIEEATRIALDPNSKEYYAKQAEVDAVIMAQ